MICLRIGGNCIKTCSFNRLIYITYKNMNTEAKLQDNNEKDDKANNERDCD